MYSWISLLAIALSLSDALAQSLPATNLFTPLSKPCPRGFSLVRKASNPDGDTFKPPTRLNADETAYVSARAERVLPSAWSAYLNNVQSTKVPLPKYVSDILSGSHHSNDLPRFSIASSGGGYRAAIFGAGVLNALDGRNLSSKSAGTGGLLQSATYLTGNSGGSWLVTSFAQANFPPIPNLVFGSNPTSTAAQNSFGGWNAQFDVMQPSSDPAVDAAYIKTLLQEVAGKAAAGFPVTVNDVWARALARHFINGTSGVDFFSNTSAHGAGILFSQLTGVPSLANHQAPLPIVVADSKSSRQNDSAILPGGNFIPDSNVIYEFSPYEMGSYDPSLSAFIPMKNLGSRNSSVCVTNFDQASFVIGTSSDIFNEFNSSLPALLQSSIGPLISLINATFPPTPGTELDATMYPNPFRNVGKRFIDSDQDFLRLVDGGEDGEVIPIQPLLVKPRGVDVILAIDASADLDDNFTAGGSLVAAQARASLFPGVYSFPPVPTSINTFVSQRLSSRPTFFGCDINDPRSDSPAPLIIYLANGAPPPGQPALTNTSSFQLSYAAPQLQSMLDQTFAIATEGIVNGTTGEKDQAWPACLACAVVDRSRERSNVRRSGVCKDCFARYCWNGIE
ncbi:lysophospholipase [Rickenella mellea]|uniref:Lysophospholipase n=1 Tax=Rickenella mellea TaxID=50990 RepID=A0A4Y7PJC1_9AGAM|nr:lysophospholipase [Rickenella mellea]